MSNLLNADRRSSDSVTLRDPTPASASSIPAPCPANESVSGAARRGPFRPELWLNARQRHASRLAAHYFRAIDVLVVVSATLLCAWGTGQGSLLETSVGQAMPLVGGAALVLALTASLNLYGFATDEPAPVHLAKVATIVVTGGAAALAIAAATSPSTWSWVLAWTAATTAALCALHLVWSRAVRRWRAGGVLTPNIVIVGATRDAERLIRDALKRRDINVLGVFDDRMAGTPDALQGVPVLGDADALMTHKITPYIDRIVVAIDPTAQARVRDLTTRLRTLPNEVTLLVDPEDDDERVTALDRLARAPLAPISGSRDPNLRAFHKRLQDLVVGGLASAILLPVIGVCAVAVKLDSPGPIFFRQRRHGFNQEEIVVWKFRSMRQEAADATASRQVTSDDDRVTKVGKVLRSTSLDELPQLLNVLAGEMSLVGPRPHAIGMKTGDVLSTQLVAEYAHRHRMKPGMTGWAAIHGSRGPLHTAQDVRRRVQLDVEYIERQSFWLDMLIMAKTVPVLLGDRLAVR